MIVILMGWLAPANSLPCLLSQDLQKYHLQIVCAPGRLHCTERSDTFLVLFLN